MSILSAAPALNGMAILRFPHLQSAEFFNAAPEGNDELSMHPFQSGTEPDIILNGNFIDATPQHFQTFEIARESLHEPNKESSTLNFHQWNQLGRKALKLLNNNTIDKIVLSRFINFQDGGRISLASSFQQLCHRHPHALVYLFYHTNSGMWMGATPEVLLNWKNGFLETVSLAGTRRYTGIPDRKWGSKELEEHRIVTEKIAEVFDNNGIQYTLGDHYTFIAGTLEHIKQDFKSKTVVEQSDYEKILKQLHPTPAVCGRPLDLALRYILEWEPHDRKYYTGYIRIRKNHQLQSFVNLRCAEVHKKSFSFFVGGGWTAHSDIENEWKETQNKYESTAQIFESLIDEG